MRRRVVHHCRHRSTHRLLRLTFTFTFLCFSVGTMRPDEGNLLDLNKLPEDHYGRDGKQVVDESSSVAGSSIKTKNSAKDGKDYPCSYCPAKFRKYQALGGHMKRHRQERAIEELNRARQLVSNHDNLAVAPRHLGF